VILCHPSSRSERVFVEAIVRLTTYQLSIGQHLITATNELIKTIATGLGGKIDHRDPFENLKRRFISRPERPAKRFELLRLVEEGRKDGSRPGEAGTPSIYQPTGLLLLLPPHAHEACLASTAVGMLDPILSHAS
jgi:hypothetical protein